MKKQEVNQETSTQFKQFIPANFITMELQEGNYCGSTNSKWKNKPPCEKYGFNYQGNWIQIDIPHNIMEILELEKEEDITRPIYLDPQVLKRNPSYGGITIKSETEIILVDPEKVIMEEAEVQTELSDKKESNQRVKELEAEIDDLKEKHNQFRQNVSNILYPNIEGATLAENDRELISQAGAIIKKLEDAKIENERIKKQKEWLIDYLKNENTPSQYARIEQKFNKATQNY